MTKILALGANAPFLAPAPHGVGQLMVTFCRGRSLLAAIFISLLGCVRPPQRQCVNSLEDSGTENTLMFTCAT